MDDFPGILARDFGFKPQGKSAPMAAPRSSSTSASGNFGVGSDHPHRSSSTSSSKPIFDDHDHLFNDVFGGPPKYSSQPSANSTPAFDYESIFKDQTASKSGSNAPVFDKPVYDEDIFEGLPGIKSSSTSGVPSGGAKFTNVASMNKPKSSSSPFDDLLGNLGNKDAGLKSDRPNESEKDSSDFRDLLAGFGGSGSSNRSTSESGRFQKSSSNSANAASSVMDDPFVVLESSSAPASGIFPDPLEEISKFSSSGNTRLENASVGSGVFDDIDPLQSLGKSAHPTSSDGNKMGKDRSPLKNGAKSAAKSSASQETVDKFRMDSNDSHSQKRMPVDNFQESHETIFDMPNVSTDFHRSVGRSASPPSYMNPTMHETNSQANSTPRAKEAFESPDDVWLTVSEIPLFTQPTSAPPPSRPPPPRPTRVSRSETGSFSSTSARKKVNEYSSFPNSTKYAESPKSAPTAARSSIDELEDFAMGRTHNSVNERAEVPSGDDFDSNSVAAASAAAMKEAMDRAEAKFRHAKEMREREYLKAARSKEAVQQDRDEYAQDQELRERQERLERERQQREREEEEREQRRLEKERERAREIEREREEKEREQRKLERERLERERELARLAVERATREARERAAAEARVKAERAAVEKAAAEARERAGRAAVQRVQAEARERAAADARERAERAAAEARERASAEAREREARERARAERAAVERAAAEARERAAAEARERAAAAAARANQQKNDNDLESFFNMGRASSAPRPRANPVDPMADAQNRGVPDTTRRSSVGNSSSMKKASSTTNIVDDLSSIFGAAASSSGEFQEVEGETEERRRARLERHQRTQERAAKALAEKNQRDLQAQREQAERHRIAETLDIEIKRWAAGKDGNLRALLSTLQYVLWPESGWQPVSLTDLITAAAVKKVYRKATLCIHPDKVQQKGANLQQKYIAEKVFDLLKEAWNKFNSEELF